MFCSVIILRKEKRLKSHVLEHSSSAFKVCYRTSSPAACQREVNPKSKQSLCKLFTYSSCLWFCYVHRFSKIFIYIFIGVCFPKHNELFLYLSNSIASRKFVVRPLLLTEQASALCTCRSILGTGENKNSANCLLYMPALLNIRKSTFVFSAAVLIRSSRLGYNGRVSW